MMRALWIALILLMVALVCPTLPANDEPSGDSTVVVVERIQDLKLTDEQEAKVAEIRKDFKPKVEEAAKELSALVKEEKEQVSGVLTDEQKQKLESFREERKEHRGDGLAQRIAHLKDLHLTQDEESKIKDIRSEYRPKIEKAMEGLKGILTAQQQTAREDGLREGKSRREILTSLNLNAEQKEKAETACKEVGTAVKEEMEKIKEVLTPEQQAQMTEFRNERADRVRDRWAHRVANARELNLTDDQKTKIENIRKEFRPKIHEAGNKLRTLVREEIGAIAGVIKD
jgi:Spy/CpxP family protein refolding chaperone